MKERLLSELLSLVFLLVLWIVARYVVFRRRITEREFDLWFEKMLLAGLIVLIVAIVLANTVRN